METRGLHPLARKEAVDGLAMDAEDTPDAHRIKPAVVNQAPDRLRMDAELVRNLPDAHETRLSIDGRHDPCKDSQVSNDAAWAEWTKCSALRA